MKSLPAEYGVSEDGIHQTLPGQRVMPHSLICSLFHVAALTRTQDGQDWSLVIEILTPDQTINTLILSKQKLTARRRDALGELQAVGMNFKPANEHDVIALLNTWRPAARQVSVKTLGWDRDLQMFVMPDGAVATGPEAQDKYVYSGPRTLSRSGSLAGWQNEVASLCVGNPHLGLCLECGGNSLAAFSEHVDLGLIRPRGQG
jgi:hypothetical protein